MFLFISFPQVFIVGDLNTYSFEDPMAVLTSFVAADRTYTISTAVNTELDNGAAVEITTGLGYIDITETQDPDGFSYFYNGELGALTHIVGTSEAAAVVEDLERWNINAQELADIEYDTALQYHNNNDDIVFIDVGPYRSSDHDPVLVSLDLAGMLV